MNISAASLADSSGWTGQDQSGHPEIPKNPVAQGSRDLRQFVNTNGRSISELSAMRATHWFLACLLATAGAAHADVTLAGVKYEEVSEVRGARLQLNGAGIPYKGPFKVYA